MHDAALCVALPDRNDILHSGCLASNFPLLRPSVLHASLSMAPIFPWNATDNSKPASGVSPRKITAVFTVVFAKCNRCIWRLHGGNRRWDINTHYTLILAVRRQSPCSSSSSGSSFSLSHSFATDFRRLFSNKIDNNRRPCAPGCTPAHGRWVRRAI